VKGLRRVWDTFVDWQVYSEVFPKLFLRGLPNTLILTVLSAIIGTLVGLLLASMGSSPRRLWRLPAAAYTNVMRALPAMLSIYLIGQGLPLAGIKIFGDNTYGYAALGIGLMEAAYLGEIFRSGMQSVERTYTESAVSLGLKRWQVLFRVILPIGFRRIIPALTNQYIIIIKATSFVYLLGLSINQRDLFSMAKDEVGIRGTLSPLVAVGAVYLIVTLPLTALVNRFDRRMRDVSPDDRRVLINEA
jgi:His/Glu/Gln/Arg/opine family amino acid ABC transporter permease subunit